MKKYLISILIAATIFPMTAYGISVGWDRYIVGGLRTLYPGDNVLIGGRATSTLATLEVATGFTSSPYYNGTSTATSTFAGGLNLTGGCFAIGGVCIGSSGGLSGGNPSDRWATSTDLTSIYPNTATKVGIGTSSPYAALSVVGSTGVVAEQYHATGTTASIFPYASTTALTAALLCLGTDCRSSWPTGSGSAYAWTPTSNYGEVASATTSPVWFRGTLYASSTARLSTTTAPSINNILYGAYAGGSNGGAKANTSYNLLSGGGLIDFSNQGLQMLSTAINFSTPGKRVLLQGGTGSSTVFHSTLAGTSTTINWGSGDVSGQDHDFGAGIDGLTFRGGDDVFDTSVGVVLGGSNGAEGTRISHSRITNFAKGLVFQNNTWNTSIDNSMFNGNGRNFVWEADTNAGENISIVSSVFADSWSGSSTNNYYRCFDVSKGGVGISMVNSALDDCQLYVGNASTISLVNHHGENAAGDGTGNKYTFYHIEPSEYTTLQMLGGLTVQGATADMPDQLIYNGGNASIFAHTVRDSGGGVVPYLVRNDNTNSGGSLVLSGVSNIGGSAFAHVTSKDPSDYDVTADGYRYIQYYAQNQDSYPFIMHVTPQSDTLFWSGNHQALTMSAAGYFGLGTTTPKYALHVYRANGTNAESCITQGTFSEFCTKAQDAQIRQTYSDPLYWDSDGVGTTRMTLLTNGNLGLGTTTPYAKLSVAGDVVANAFTATSGTSTLAGLNIPTLNCASYSNAGKLTVGSNGDVVCGDDATVALDNGWTSEIQGYTFPDGTNVNTDIAAVHWDTLKPMWYELTGSTLTLRTVGDYGYSPENVALIKANSTYQYVVLTDGYADFASLMASTTGKSTAITTMVNFVVTNDFTGVALDIEGFSDWNATQYGQFKTWVTSLCDSLHSNGKKCLVYVPPIWNEATGGSDEWDTVNSQSWYELTYEDMSALPIDYIEIPVYDYHFDWGVDRPDAPLGWLDDIITYAKAKINDDSRIVIGIPAAGHYGAIGGWSPTALNWAQASVAAGFSGAVRDEESGMLTWTNGGNRYFISDETTIGLMRERAEAAGIKHVSIWYVGDNQYSPQLGNSPGIPSQWTTNGTSISYLTNYFWNDGHVTFGDASNNGILDVAASSSNTVFANDTSQAAIHLRNIATTVGNWFDIVFESADQTQAAAIGAQIYDQTNHYARLVFSTRGPSGYSRVMDLYDGNVGIGTTSPNAKFSIAGAAGGKMIQWITSVGTNMLDIVNDTATAVLKGTWDFSGATVKQHMYKGITWPGVATTTTATTSVPIGQAMVPTDFEKATCRVTSGSGSYQFSDGTNKTDYRTASTTGSRYSFTTNDTWVTDENMILEVGPLTNAQITCGIDMIQN